MYIKNSNGDYSEKNIWNSKRNMKLNNWGILKGAVMKYFYDEMTWPEIKEAAKNNRVALIPVGSIEDHGKHLPVMTDNLIITSLCSKVGKQIPEDVVVLPNAPYGFEAHHMDFPGSIDVHWHTLIQLWICIGKSLAHHGFKKIVFANGHGSNASPLDLASREVTLQTDSLCATFSWWSIVESEASQLRESEKGGVSHGGEMETSLVMYLRPELVKKEYLVKEIPPASNFIWRDLLQPSPVKFMDYWSTMTESGTVGDATAASPEKGEKLFHITVKKICSFVKEFRARKIIPRKNYQGEE